MKTTYSIYDVHNNCASNTGEFCRDVNNGAAVCRLVSFKLSLPEIQYSCGMPKCPIQQMPKGYLIFQMKCILLLEIQSSESFHMIISKETRTSTPLHALNILTVMYQHPKHPQIIQPCNPCSTIRKRADHSESPSLDSSAFPGCLFEPVNSPDLMP